MITLIAWLALVVALVAGVYVWRLSSELATATRRLDRYNKALFDANDEIRKLREGMQEEMARLRVAMHRQQGTSAFTPEMTLREVLMIHPQAEQVLAGFHLGGCSHCAVEPDETLAQAAAEHGIDLPTLMQNLNMLIAAQSSVAPAGAAPRASDAAPTLVKLPNVALEF